ncbi:hypothetical protein AAXE64_27010 [Priestia megaterium]
MEGQIEQKKNGFKEVFLTHVEKSKQKDKKAWLINAIIILVIALFFIILHLNHVKQYRENIYKTSELIREGMVDSELMVSDYKTTWDDAIEYDMDFNIALAEKFDEYDTLGYIDDVQDTQKKVKKNMAALNDPPGKYEDAHKYLLEMYASYKTYSNLSIEPEGSLTTYSAKTQELESEVDESIDKVETLIDK